MRRFVLEVLAFVLLQVAILIAASSLCPRDPDHYAAAAIDKRRRIATTPGPRIVSVGGSSVSFGIDSREIEARGLASVNMGHNVGLGLEFMLSQTAAHLRAGDIVIVTPELELLWARVPDASLINLLEHDPVSARYLDASTCGRLVDGGLRWMGSQLRCALHQLSTEADIAFTRRSFDERGDFVQHRGRAPTVATPLPIGWPDRLGPELDHAIARLDSFGSHCEEVGARCVLAMPPLRPAQHAAGRPILDELERRIQAAQRMPLILPAADAVAPPSAFVDPGPHLTEAAAAERTRWLLDALEL